MNNRSIPYTCHRRKDIIPYCLTEPRIYLTCDDVKDFNDTRFVMVQDGIYVSPEAYEDGFNEAYFATPIEEGDQVYAPLYGRGDFLPTWMKYVVVRKDTKPIFPENEFYKRITLTDEKALADIYKQAWQYTYIPETDSYMPLTKEGALHNITKLFLENDIRVISGDAMDRVADYGRLFLFLLSKVLPLMSEEEQMAFEGLEPYIPAISNLHHVINREANIQHLIAEHKKNPLRSVSNE